MKETPAPAPNTPSSARGDQRPKMPRPSPASHVQVAFSPAGEQTLVVLSHTGWEAFDGPDAARAEYDRGWPRNLQLYSDDANQSQPGQVTGTRAKPG
jgi:hypothetical protein